jgi:hypothetical protein
MKRLSLILTILVVLGLCAFTSNKTIADFKLVSATKMVTMGGAAGSPTYTQYKITLKAQRSFTFTCDSAVADGRITSLLISSDTSYQLKTKKVKKGQLVKLNFTIVQASDNGNNNTGLQFSSSPEAKVPINSKSGVVLRYYTSQKKYFNVSSVNTQLPVYAP